MIELYEVRAGNTAVIWLDNAPVNSLSLPVRTSLIKSLLAAEEDDLVEAIVIAGRGIGFCAGGDISEFNDGKALAFPTPSEHIFPLIESLQKPVIAAIEGFALGGGLELALACHARVASPQAKLGLPETKLGMLPGAGGTQRLPRAIGLEKATNMILSGQTYAAHTFEPSTLVDVLTEHNVVDVACQVAKDLSSSGLPFPLLKNLTVNHSEPEGYMASVKLGLRRRLGYNSGMDKALEAISKSFTVGLDKGCAFEQSLFRGQVLSDDAKALRHVFTAERTCTDIVDIPVLPQPRRIKTAAVIGTGFMGTGIAICLARAGITVGLYDSRPGSTKKCIDQIKLSEKEIIDSVYEIDSFDAFPNVDLVVEAIHEDLRAKIEIFAMLGNVTSNQTILASNTSSLDLNEIARASGAPDRVIGLHFFGPAQVMKLLEVVRGEATSDEVLSTSLALAKTLKKVPVVAKVCPGFIGNRIFDQFLNQALCLVNEGAQPEDVDKALEGWGMRMGPFKVMDMIGIDLLLQAWKDRFSVPLLEKLVQIGRLGQKSGNGWYRYKKGVRGAQPDSNLKDLLDIPSVTTLSKQDIVDRCIFALVNEGYRVLEEGVAQRESDIDITFIYGYGFPLLMGGPMFHARKVGLPLVLRKIKKIQTSTRDPFWQPAAQLEQLAGAFLNEEPK